MKELFENDKFMTDDDKITLRRMRSIRRFKVMFCGVLWASLVFSSGWDEYKRRHKSR